jgi:hypothetical protein
VSALRRDLSFGNQILWKVWSDIVNRRFLFAMPLLLLAACATVEKIEGPAAILEKNVSASMTRDELVKQLGPAGQNVLHNYIPPLMELTYPRWGISAIFDMGGGLRSLHVSKRWSNTLHGIRVGDDLNALRSSIKIAQPAYAGDQFLELLDYPGWLVTLDKETGRRIEKISFLYKDAPVYSP